MPICHSRSNGRSTAILALLILVVAGWGIAYQAKSPVSPLDGLVFESARLRVTDTVADAQFAPVAIPNLAAVNSMLADLGPAWSAAIELRTGRPTLIEGGAIPWIPGPANSLSWQSFGSTCDQNACIPVETVEALARQFLARYPSVFMLDGYDLVIDPDGSGPVWDSIYFLRFQPYYKGVPMKRASVIFRLNNGNLIQVVVDKLGTLPADATPSLTTRGAWDILFSHIGGPGQDTVVESGVLEFIPVTPKGMDPEVFNGRVGSMLEHQLVWRMSFTRKGMQGTWEALVDARAGELLAFRDSNRYGHIHGGIRPSDGIPPEENRPFPYADTGLASPNNYSDNAGNFTGTSATSTLVGKYAHISDACGSISNTTTTGDMDFITDNAAGTDCVVPPGNTGGPGNTHSSRTMFYNLTAINLKAQIYNPSNTFLTTSYMTANVNGSAMCNASSGGGVVNFYKHVAGSCNNLGEIPGVAMHEWAHSYDDVDGSGADTPPLETYADWTAIIQTHNSCTGAGFLIGSNCDGYGDACNACTGVRDCDYTKHASNAPWTSANHPTGTPSPPTTIWGCSSGGYNGPCGWEDHCESGISTQALWDFVYRDLTDACPGGPMCNNGFTPLDITTAWMLEDRLWFTGVQTLTSSYTCSSGTTSGCSGTVLYSVMRALDDDGDGTANGTPHAHAIYHAMQRHLIHCNTWNDSSAQNQNQTSCLALNTPTLSATAGNNQAVLNWTTGGTNATRYFVYRNESNCDVAFNRIAIVNAPTLTYTDNGVVNGTTYYYRVQAVTANDSCVSPSSNCVNVTPQPCAASVSLDKPIYSCAGTVNVSVLDSTPGASPWTAQAWSTSDATPRSITLANNPSGSATYTGTFATTTGTGGAGVVHVASGDTLTVRFADPSYCTSGSVNVDKTAIIDCAGPVISNVQVTALTDSTATVTWTTSEAANSRVTYGTSTPPATNRDDLTNYTTAHSLIVTGLAGCTDHFFSVTSADVAGNSATDGNGGAYYTFKTYGRSYAMGPDTVEGGVLSWVVSPATGTDIWHQDACKAVSGTKSWKAGKSDAPTCTAQYASSLSNYYLAWNANITLGSAGHGYHLRFNEWYDTESNTGCTYDPLRTQISTDGGTNWTTLATRCGASGGWIARDYDLAAYTGSTVRIRFYFTSDSSANGLGWYVDDIEVSKSQSCTAEMAYQSTTWTDACNGTGTGAGNGYLDAGEAITVHPVLRNAGSQGATGITATLSTSTPGITVTGASASYADLVAGASAACNAPHLAFSVGTGVACGTVIDFTLTITAATGGGPWTQNFSLTVGNVVPGGAITDFSQNFGSVTTPALPAGWTVSSTSGNAWRTATTACTTIGLQYPYSTTAAANSWAYTPGIALSAGTTYTLAFNQKIESGTYPEIFEVKCGASASPAGQTITVLASATYTNTTCTARSATFTVPSTGTYYIGFHCTSAADMYYLWIDDIALTHNSTPSCTMSACAPTTCTAPGAPVLTSATGDCDGVDLAWTAGSGATNAYNVYRSDNAVCPAGSLTKLNASPLSAATLVYSDTTAVGGTPYTYIVRGACDASGSGESADSNCRAATRGASPAGAPAAPVVADISGCAASGVSITWGAVAGGSAYDLQIDGGAVITGVTSPYTRIPGDALSHTYAVRATSACGNSAFSATTAGTDANAGPPSVGTLTMRVISANMLVSWVEIANPALVDYYEVMRALSPAGPFDVSVGTAAGGIHGLFLNLAAEPGTAYYKVRAVKGLCAGPLD